MCRSKLTSRLCGSFPASWKLFLSTHGCITTSLLSSGYDWIFLSVPVHVWLSVCVSQMWPLSQPVWDELGVDQLVQKQVFSKDKERRDDEDDD